MTVSKALQGTPIPGTSLPQTIYFSNGVGAFQTNGRGFRTREELRALLARHGVAKRPMRNVYDDTATGVTVSVRGYRLHGYRGLDIRMEPPAGGADAYHLACKLARFAHGTWARPVTYSSTGKH